MIRHLRHHEIDRQRWDACVISSSTPLVYGESWFLDITSPGWEGLVADDYRAVFPLPIRKQWGIRYVFQPPFSQQLGSFGMTGADEFLERIPDDIKLVDLQLNTSSTSIGCNHKTLPNLLLELGKPVEEIRSGYSDNLRRNLRKASKSGLEHTDRLDIDELIVLFREHRGKNIETLSDFEYKTLKLLVETGSKRGLVEIGGIRSVDGNLIAGALFLKSRHGWIFLFSATNPLGREFGAMSAVIDHFIEKHAGENTCFDFEGSSDPNLNRFYKSFGSAETVYLRIRINRLPFPLRLFKRPL